MAEPGRGLSHRSRLSSFRALPTAPGRPLRRAQACSARQLGIWDSNLDQLIRSQSSDRYANPHDDRNRQCRLLLASYDNSAISRRSRRSGGRCARRGRTTRGSRARSRAAHRRRPGCHPLAPCTWRYALNPSRRSSSRSGCAVSDPVATATTRILFAIYGKIVPPR